MASALLLSLFASFVEIIAGTSFDCSQCDNRPTITTREEAFASVANGDKIECWDVSGLTSMQWFFKADFNIRDIDLSCWDTKAVTNLERPFYTFEAFNADISSWDTSSVTSMNFMFYNTDEFNGDISSWDTSSVTDMYAAFYYAKAFSGDVSSWDISRVENGRWMFYGCPISVPMCEWDVLNDQRWSNMFKRGYPCTPETCTSCKKCTKIDRKIVCKQRYITHVPIVDHGYYYGYYYLQSSTYDGDGYSTSLVWSTAPTDRDTFNTKFVANGGLVERTCPSCGSDHQTMVYKRTSALPAGKDWYQLFMQDWFSSQNNINTDFKLYSSVSDAETDTNAWQYCNYDDPGVGFPRDCGKTGGVGGQWNSLTRGGRSASWEMPQ